MNEIIVNENELRRDKIFDFLQVEGFRPEKVDENSIKLRYEGKTVWVDIDLEDETYYQIIAANIWSIESPEELSRAYVASSKATRSYKVAKTFVRQDETNIWTAADHFESDVQNLLPKLIRLIQIVNNQAKTFAEIMHELELKSSPVTSLQ